MSSTTRDPNYADMSIGQRCELHPATDLWMRGARYGTIAALDAGYVYVSVDRLDGRRVRFEPHNIDSVWSV